MIVPYSAGGASDIICRLLAQSLAGAMGQVVVENRPGASAIIGTNLLRHAEPDGYTIMMADIAHAANPALRDDLPYDSIRDFQPVTLVATLPTVLLVNPSLPAKSVPELIGLAKAHPKILNFSSSGIGSSSHLAGEMFKTVTGTDLVHVPYKGGGESLNALLAGDVQVLFTTLPSALPFIRAGKIRALAVSTQARMPALPDVPTLGEQGVTGAGSSLWMGVLVPVGTPPGIVARLHDEIGKALATDTVRQRLADMGAQPVGDTPAQFSEFIEAQIARWKKALKRKDNE
ncbi:tripartite tricarboxylate transporter substrate binding protein [Pigmentiphaga soli]|uniref:Tripartite tricarboxylate transporter substrate binding protein n=1 Tax=Pigmentiphaga soli TaxID=1007095 RepID=A0ABP8GTF3_9BURK